MMDNKIFLANCRKAVATVVAYALGITRIVRGKFEIGPIELRKLIEVVEREKTIDPEDLVVGDCQRALHETAQLWRHCSAELEPDHRSAPALFQRRFKQPHEVFGLFFDFNLGVADGAECSLPFCRVAWKESADEQRCRFFQRDQSNNMISAAGELDEPFYLLRHADERIHRLAVFAAGELQGDGESQIGYEREWMCRIDRERRQQRKDVSEKVVFEPAALGLLEIGCVHKHDVCGGQCWTQLQPALLLIVSELGDRFADAGHLLGRSKTVWTLSQNALPQLTFQPSHANHEKFIKVVGRNREEAHAFEQRMVLVCRFFQNASIEVKPGQFAVDEPLGARSQIGKRWRGAGLTGVAALLPEFYFSNGCNALTAIRHLKDCLPI